MFRLIRFSTISFVPLQDGMIRGMFSGLEKRQTRTTVGTEPRLSNEINKLGGANGIANLQDSTKTFNSTFPWTLDGR
jgi:hypothetical protein